MTACEGDSDNFRSLNGNTDLVDNTEGFKLEERETNVGSFRLGGEEWGLQFQDGPLQDIPAVNGAGNIDLNLDLSIGNDNNINTLDYPAGNEGFVTPQVLANDYLAYLLCAGVVQGPGQYNYVIGKFYDNIQPANIVFSNNQLNIKFKINQDTLRLGISCKLEISPKDDPNEIAYTQVLELNTIVIGNSPSFNDGNGPYYLRTNRNHEQLQVSAHYKPEAQQEPLIPDGEALLQAITKFIELNELHQNFCGENYGNELHCPETKVYQYLRVEQRTDGDALICLDQSGVERENCFIQQGPRQGSARAAHVWTTEPLFTETRQPFTGDNVQGLGPYTTFADAIEYQNQEHTFRNINGKNYLVNTCSPDLMEFVSKNMQLTSAALPLRCQINEGLAMNIFQPYKTITSSAKRKIRWQIAKSILVPMAIAVASIAIPGVIAGFLGYGAHVAVALTYINALGAYAGLITAPLALSTLVSSAQNLKKCGNDFQCKAINRASIVGAAAELLFLPADAVTLPSTAKSLKIARGRIVLEGAVKNYTPDGFNDVFVLGIVDDAVKNLIKNANNATGTEYDNYVALIDDLRRKVKDLEPDQIVSKLDDFLVNSGKQADELEYADFRRLMDEWDNNQGGEACLGLVGLTCDSFNNNMTINDIEVGDYPSGLSKSENGVVSFSPSGKGDITPEQNKVMGLGILDTNNVQRANYNPDLGNYKYSNQLTNMAITRAKNLGKSINNGDFEPFNNHSPAAGESKDPVTKIMDWVEKNKFKNDVLGKGGSQAAIQDTSIERLLRLRQFRYLGSEWSGKTYISDLGSFENLAWSEPIKIGQGNVKASEITDLWFTSDGGHRFDLLKNLTSENVIGYQGSGNRYRQNGISGIGFQPVNYASDGTMLADDEVAFIAVFFGVYVKNDTNYAQGLLSALQNDLQREIKRGNPERIEAAKQEIRDLFAHPIHGPLLEGESLHTPID